MPRCTTFLLETESCTRQHLPGPPSSYVTRGDKAPMHRNGLLFSAQQTATISITERVASAVSVAASCIIIVTFIGFKSFRKPINRLVFYASFGNILANIGTLISESGIPKGSGSPLCQFQGFVIQW